MSKTDSQLYEELRAAIDDGSESMTHAEALAWIRDAQNVRMAVNQHNAECSLACVENLTCGSYRARDKWCPECPKQYRIDLP